MSVQFSKTKDVPFEQYYFPPTVLLITTVVAGTLAFLVGLRPELFGSLMKNRVVWISAIVGTSLVGGLSLVASIVLYRFKKIVYYSEEELASGLGYDEYIRVPTSFDIKDIRNSLKPEQLKDFENRKEKRFSQAEFAKYTKRANHSQTHLYRDPKKYGGGVRHYPITEEQLRLFPYAKKCTKFGTNLLKNT